MWPYRGQLPYRQAGFAPRPTHPLGVTINPRTQQHLNATALASPAHHHQPLRLVLVGGMGSIGDNLYRLHQPAAALAQLEGVEVFEVHPQARHHDGAVLAADVAVFTMTLDVEVFRLIHQRRQLGRPSLCEVNDYLPDVQPWNPAHGSWSDRRALFCFDALIRRCDATQVTTEALGQRLADRAQRITVVPNQLQELPPLRAFPAAAPPSAERPLVIGWGGSFGHREDLRAIAPALIAWLQRQRHVRFELMGDPVLAEPFADLDAERFRFALAGSLPHYLQWLERLDIGLAPLLPTEFNRCRSDVKFLEYASRSVVPLLQNLDPYRHLAGTGAALLYDNPDDLIRQLDRLVNEPALRQTIATTAHALVGRERRLAQHAPTRLAVYRELAQRTRSAAGTVEPLLQQAADRPLASLPGLRQLAPRHWRLGIDSPADQQRLQGVEALQRGALAEAATALAEAVRLDPNDAHALSFLGHALQRQGRLADALAAFERAASLDPLQSRPVRALARLHSRAARHYAERAAALNPLASPESPPVPEGSDRP
jgi:tetratricopeptide (TPR) repeat protein